LIRIGGIDIEEQRRTRPGTSKELYCLNRVSGEFIVTILINIDPTLINSAQMLINPAEMSVRPVR